MFYTQEQIDRANRTDLVSFLQSKGEELIKSGQEYRWKKHDSLTVKGNKWFRHSRSKGGYPIEFVMEFYGKSFTEAVEALTGERGEGQLGAVPAAPPAEFRLPPRGRTNDEVIKYLTEKRAVDRQIVDSFLLSGDIYEEAEHCNAVFVGRDKSGIPRYAHLRGTADGFRRDISGSDKTYPFRFEGSGSQLFVFEAPIDLLSFICLYPQNWQTRNYISLGGVSGKALDGFLSEREDISEVVLCLDNDAAGAEAALRLAESISKPINITRMVPLKKDWNDVLVCKSDFPNQVYVEDVIILKEKPRVPPVPMLRMSEVELTSVKWLWFPYIPFGKVTIIQGNPGDGKSYFAMRLAAACTNRKVLPNMQEIAPFNVIYQTAEDGLGDTVKPRLIEAEADLERVFVINEASQSLYLSDERIERAIIQAEARLIVLDPLQAYLGEKTDINRANEVRPVFRRLAGIAERTGCAIVLIGHLNKTSGVQSAYRGLGSIDFRAAARSVLLIGRVKKEPNIRVIIHDKSSLAPEGKPIAFRLDRETGFEWIGEYEITSDELLQGAGGNTVTKTEQAEKLIFELLSDGREMASEDIAKAAAKAGISERTLQNAKRGMSDILGARRVGGQWYNFLKKQTDEPEPQPDWSDQRQRFKKVSEILNVKFEDVTPQLCPLELPEAIENAN